MLKHSMIALCTLILGASQLYAEEKTQEEAAGPLTYDAMVEVIRGFTGAINEGSPEKAQKFMEENFYDKGIFRAEITILPSEQLVKQEMNKQEYIEHIAQGLLEPQESRYSLVEDKWDVHPETRVANFRLGLLHEGALYKNGKENPLYFETVGPCNFQLMPSDDNSRPVISYIKCTLITQSSPHGPLKTFAKPEDIIPSTQSELQKQ